ncbi:glycosyltransferase [Maribacter sp. 1_2014MBL_MicDiv]|uniref:glycosyltransferase n=1 Tax=Maribacter sp. 1_2014MBL_MicDiv TaxID=1644130 RepID=UPI0008F5051D|nr:glycosyltransferase [Maribacter sp. 1_2014MBL_MicDiv]APA65500.1 hypothetical protein YQ22_14960 [Maribacter sp. 1_2014MBL_MicDiv]
MSKNNICCIFNYAPHYRSAIYNLMDEELNCDFYFGDDVGSQITKMKVMELTGFKKTLKRIQVTKWNYYWLKGSLIPIFKPYKYYITSGGSKYLNMWVLLLISKFTKKKVIAWAHGMKGNENGLAKRLNYLYYSLCDTVLLYGERSRDIMIKEGIDSKKLVCIYNSLDYDKQLKFRQNLGNTNIYKHHFGNDHPIIIYIGRLQKSKKLEILISILNKLLNNGVNCNLVFVGKDLGDNDLKSKVNEYGLSKFTWFYGPCYDEQKNSELLLNSNLCISPGPIGLTAIHAASYGVPIITNDDFSNQMPEFEIIASGLNGDFFEKDNENDLYEKVKKWLLINNEKRSEAKIFSHSIIDEKYNPYYQIQVLKTVLNLE